MFRPDRLVQLRKQKKLTQEQLAEKVNISKAGISNYENGHSSPPNETLILLADVLQTSTDFLLDRTDESVNKNTSAENEEFNLFISNPSHGIFFKEYLDSPEERKNELMQFWRIIQEAERGRKLGDRQGEEK